MKAPRLRLESRRSSNSLPPNCSSTSYNLRTPPGIARLCHSDRLRLNARWTMTDTDVREYAAQAASTDTFGRVLCSARNHHFVVDGPVQNGCPGEAINPAELFLSGVAACGVELVQLLAKGQEGPVEGI